MGDFFGHITASMFSLILGSWWTFAILERYFKVVMSNKKYIRFKCTSSFQCFCCQNIPFEGFVKVAAISALFVLEILAYMFTDNGNILHSILYSFFGINGLCDVLMFYGCKIPADFDYISMIIAFMAEVVLISLHLGHSMTVLENQFHIFLICTSFAIATCFIVEMKYRYSVYSSLCRSFFMLLHGTWLFQMAMTVYYQPEHSLRVDKFEDLAFLSSAYIFHIFLNLIIMIFSAGMIWMKLKNGSLRIDYCQKQNVEDFSNAEYIYSLTLNS